MPWGCRGIGERLALEFAAKKCKLCLAARSLTALEVRLRCSLQLYRLLNSHRPVIMSFHLRRHMLSTRIMPLQEVAKKCTDAGALAVLPIQCDMSEPTQMKAMVEKCEAELGKVEVGSSFDTD